MEELTSALEKFDDFGRQTSVLEFPLDGYAIPVYVNEFWTAKQRAAHSLHEVSYRACFRPQLPRFFIRRLTKRGDVVYDPFMGRGTTVLEAALWGRIPFGCDINPLSQLLVHPRLDPPQLVEIEERLRSIDLDRPVDIRSDLLVFYHPDTLRAIGNLRAHLLAREKTERNDPVDAWIRMTATNRLTGHSPGFLSVYTLPPNQAVSVTSQAKINGKRAQAPSRRDLAAIIVHKSRSLLKALTPQHRDMLSWAAARARLVTGSADSTPPIPDASVSLVVTSPPFLDVVNYKADNWLRCWFNGIDPDSVAIWHLRNVAEWQQQMSAVFRELHRVLVHGGFVAFEVGEVRGGTVLLEELVVPAGAQAGLEPILIVVNDQVFTKTANCWGVDNLRKGTNTNRIVLLRKATA